MPTLGELIESPTFREQDLETQFGLVDRFILDTAPASDSPDADAKLASLSNFVKGRVAENMKSVNDDPDSDIGVFEPGVDQILSRNLIGSRKGVFDHDGVRFEFEALPSLSRNLLKMTFPKGEVIEDFGSEPIPQGEALLDLIAEKHQDKFDSDNFFADRASRVIQGFRIGKLDISEAAANVIEDSAREGLFSTAIDTRAEIAEEKLIGSMSVNSDGQIVPREEVDPRFKKLKDGERRIRQEDPEAVIMDRERGKRDKEIDFSDRNSVVTNRIDLIGKTNDGRLKSEIFDEFAKGVRDDIGEAQKKGRLSFFTAEREEVLNSARFAPSAGNQLDRRTSGFSRFTQDVASGIGSTIPAIALGPSMTIPAAMLQTGNAQYRNVLQIRTSAGDSFFEADKQARKAAVDTALSSGVIEGIADRFLGGLFFKALGKEAATSSIKTIAKGVVTGAATEFPTETAQSALEQAIANEYRKNEDKLTAAGITQEALYEGFVGAFSGGIIGGGASAGAQAANVLSNFNNVADAIVEIQTDEGTTERVDEGTDGADREAGEGVAPREGVSTEPTQANEAVPEEGVGEAPTTPQPEPVGDEAGPQPLVDDQVEPGPVEPEEAVEPSEEVQEPDNIPDEAFDDLADEITTLEPVEFPVVEVPVADIKLSADVPNFKGDADPATGIVPGQQLEGKFQRLGSGAIVVWERSNGDLEVITGRHRLDLARRSGETTIPSQIVREKDGFTKDQALVFDAASNIRDGQGNVRDYAQFFRHSAFTEEGAASQGLLARSKGRSGWDIGKLASDDLYALYRAEKITEGRVLAIVQAAGSDAGKQRAGIQLAQTGSSAELIGDAIRSLSLRKDVDLEGDDLFGSNDAALNQVKLEAARAGKFRAALKNDIAAAQGAARRPEAAKRMGVDVNDPAAVKAKVAELKAELVRWKDWHKHPDLAALVRSDVEPGVVAAEPAKAPEKPAQAEPVAPAETPSTPAAIQGGIRPDQDTLFGEDEGGFSLTSQETQVVEPADTRTDTEKDAEVGQESLFGEETNAGTAPAQPEPGLPPGLPKALHKKPRKLANPNWKTVSKLGEGNPTSVEEFKKFRKKLRDEGFAGAGGKSHELAGVGYNIQTWLNPTTQEQLVIYTPRNWNLQGGVAPVTNPAIPGGIPMLTAKTHADQLAIHDALGVPSGEPGQKTPTANVLYVAPQSQPEGYGKGNKVFTKDVAEKARETLRKKFDPSSDTSGENRALSGLDPELATAAFQLAGFHIEAGARKFSEFSKKMVGELGSSIEPYLKSAYVFIRNYPGFDATGMSTDEEIDRFQKTGAETAPEAKPVSKPPKKKPAAKKEETPKKVPVEVDGGGATSTMNEVADAERAARGKEPVLKSAIRTNEETFAAAEAKVAGDPGYAARLIDGLIEGTRTTVSEVDEAVLLYEKVRLRNTRDAQADRIDSSVLENDLIESQREWDALEAQIDRVDIATRRSGEIWGRLGQFRQRLMHDDFTFEAMEQRKRVSLGRPLTSEESAKIKEQADEIAKLQEQLEEANTRADNKAREQALEEKIAELEAEAKELAKQKVPPHIVKLANKVADRVHSAAENARERLKERGFKLRSEDSDTNEFRAALPDPKLIADLAIIGADYLMQGVARGTEWTAKMVGEFGESIREHLPEILKKANARISKEFKKGSGQTRPSRQNLEDAGAIQKQRDDIVERIETKIAEDFDGQEDPGILTPLVQKLALNFVRSGISERKALVKAVHGVLSGFTNVTVTETIDMISGYGDFKPLDREEAKVTLRGLKGELQQIRKVMDLRKKHPPEKTGIERREPTAEERRLIKLVNELKRKGGFIVTDPARQLKSALDAIKTRLRNEITDLDRAIAGERRLVVKKSNVEYDAETEALKKTRDEKRAEYDKMFPKKPLTDEQLIELAHKSVDRSIEQLEKDLKEGRLYAEVKGPKPTTVDLEAKRARLEELRAERQQLRDLDFIKRQQKELARLEKLGDELRSRLAGTHKKATRPGVPETPEIRNQKKVNAELRAQIAAIKAASPEAMAQKIENAIKAAEKSLAEYDRRIREGDFSKRTGTKKPLESDALDAVKAERDAVASYFQELKAYDPDTIAERQKKRIAAVNLSIAKLDKQIRDGDVKAKAKPEKPISVELEQLISERDAMRRFRDELRREGTAKTRDEIRLQSYMLRTTKRIAELQQRLANKDYSTKTIEPLVLDKAGRDLADKLAFIQREFNIELLKDKEARKGFFSKSFSHTVHGINSARAVMTAYDVSAPGRQGILLSASHPILAYKAAGKMFKALVSKGNYNEINRNLFKRKNADLYRRSKLFLVHPDELTFSKMEEAYQSRWAEKVPGVEASGNAFKTFLNVLRADAFDALANTAGRINGPLTTAQGKAIANYINIATGRGNLAGASGAAVSLNAAFFSPRLLVSRFEYLIGTPLLGGDAVSRKIIATEYARTIGALGIVITLATLAGAELEDDPRSTDFMKLKFGKTRVDVLGGLLPAVVLAYRIGKGEKKTISGRVAPIRGTNLPHGADDAWDVFGRFVRTKLNPALGTFFDLATGTTVVGDEVTPLNAPLRLVTPLAMVDVYESLKEEGFPEGVIFGLLALLGFGVQVHENRGVSIPQTRRSIPLR